jgi:hypothetical protein
MNHLSWKAYFIVAVSLLVIWFALRATLLAAEPACSRYFPLEKGNYWIYHGETTWAEPQRGGRRSARPQAKRAVLTWKMEVVDTLCGNGWQAALLKGFPGDLSWFEPGMARGDHLILQIGGGSYYLFHETDALEIWTGLKTSRVLRPGVATAESLFFTAPLARGRIYGGSRQNVKRGLYCWVVRADRPFDPKCFPNAPVIQPARVFTMVYTTSPDSTTIDFVPGLGVVGYQYRHHGTPAETSLTLVDFGTSMPVFAPAPPSKEGPSPGEGGD